MQFSPCMHYLGTGVLAGKGKTETEGSNKISDPCILPLCISRQFLNMLLSPVLFAKENIFTLRKGLMMPLILFSF